MAMVLLIITEYLLPLFGTDTFKLYLPVSDTQALASAVQHSAVK